VAFGSDRVKRLGHAAVVLLAAVVWAPLALGAAQGVGGERPDLVIPRVERPPTLEDFLGMKPNGEMEGQLTKVGGLIQKEPSDGAPSSQEADVYLGYDDKHLYIIFVAFDSEPDKVRARMVPREDFGGDDFVQVLLDTFNDQRRAYSFMANPFGIQRDALFTEGSRRRGGGGGCEGSFDFSFDTLWHSKGHRTDQGYVIWMSIPFKSLRFPSAPQQTWGILLYRNIPRVNEESFWPHCSSRVQGRLNQGATMRGLENISPGRNIQLIPYASFRSFRGVDTRDEDNPQFVRDRADPDAGLDAKFVLNDSLVVDVAVNPDFSQVESDEPQVTVNQRFEVFFPEKRPFFLENASFFQTPINLLFTRRIADPRVGARLTGKLGPYAIGAFVIDDESPGKSVLAGDPLEGKRAWFSTVRVNRDLGAQSTLGFIYTDREFEDSYSRVGGVDGRLRLSDNWTLTFQGVTSATFDAEDDERLAGPAYNAELTRSGRQFFYQVEYEDISPGFRTESGFVRRTDIRAIEQAVRYRFRPEGKFLISWGPSFNTQAVFDHTDAGQPNQLGIHRPNRPGFFLQLGSGAAAAGGFRGTAGRPGFFPQPQGLLFQQQLFFQGDRAAELFLGDAHQFFSSGGGGAGAGDADQRRGRADGAAGDTAAHRQRLYTVAAARAGERGEHLQQPHFAVEVELSVQPRTVAADDPAVQLGAGQS
jgi:hypothetical protein